MSDSQRSPFSSKNVEEYLYIRKCLKLYKSILDNLK